MYCIFNAEEVRCVCFLGQKPNGPPAGQQMVSWLPAGTYKVEGVETIRVSTLGQVNERQAARLLRPTKDGVRDTIYYVSLNQLPNEVVDKLNCTTTSVD